VRPQFVDRGKDDGTAVDDPSAEQERHDQVTSAWQLKPCQRVWWSGSGMKLAISDNGRDRETQIYLRLPREYGGPGGPSGFG
jgi:hypothetical protein